MGKSEKTSKEFEYLYYLSLFYKYLLLFLGLIAADFNSNQGWGRNTYISLEVNIIILISLI